MLLGSGCGLRPHALFLIARAIVEHPEAATFVYADDDLLDGSGQRCQPRFKPDWNQALLDGQNYIGPCAAFRADLATADGRSPRRARRGGDLDAFPPADRSRLPDTIRHLPHVLLHRTGVGETAHAGARSRTTTPCPAARRTSR